MEAEKDLAFAMDLFYQYDYDRSGKIDKVAFKSLALEFKAENDRLKVLQLASAVVGSLVGYIVGSGLLS